MKTFDITFFQIKPMYKAISSFYLSYVFFLVIFLIFQTRKPKTKFYDCLQIHVFTRVKYLNRHITVVWTTNILFALLQSEQMISVFLLKLDQIHIHLITTLCINVNTLYYLMPYFSLIIFLSCIFVRILKIRWITKI